MIKANLNLLVIIAFVSFCFVACKKTDESKFLTYQQFVNPKTGKYIIYQLDSIVPAPFGKSLINKFYLIKDSIVEKFLDNQNRESYKVFRYQYDSTAKVWKSSNTFFLTPSDTRLEYVEDNLRYVTLTNPISEFHSWQGNNYISEPVIDVGGNFNTWTYYYQDVNQPAQIGALKFDKTVTVVQYDSSDNKPFTPNNYSSYIKSYEIYADTIGLVYKDFISWEYQAFTSTNNCTLTKPKAGGGLDTSFVNCSLANCDSLGKLPNYKITCDTSLNQFYYNGYGITQKIISHN